LQRPRWTFYCGKTAAAASAEHLIERALRSRQTLKARGSKQEVESRMRFVGEAAMHFTLRDNVETNLHTRELMAGPLMELS